MLLYWNRKTGLLLSNLCENIAKKLIWKFTNVFPNQVLKFLKIFTEHGRIMADYTINIERILQLLCRNVIVERLLNPKQRFYIQYPRCFGLNSRFTITFLQSSCEILSMFFV